MRKKRRYYCYLSGELPSRGLPSYEVIAILKSFKENFDIIEFFDQVLLISAYNNICDLIVERAAYVHGCGEVIFIITEANIKKITKAIKNYDFNSILDENSSFAVRIKKIKEYFPKILVEKMEREIGREIETVVNKQISVNLKNPDILFLGIFTENKFIFGVNFKNTQRKNFRLRAPHTRPFFHPCGLDPFLARAMVNLSEINGSEIIYDPFCGTGSLLIEAALIGIKSVGSDISQKMVRGSSLNLKAFGIQDINIFRADSRKHCLNNRFCLVTDPPYGRASSIYGKNLEKVLLDLFKNNSELMVKNCFNVLALPSSLKIDFLLLKYDFKIQHRFEYYVHRSLTRDIYVIKKM